jgi:hypothetical protein
MRRVFVLLLVAAFAVAGAVNVLAATVTNVTVSATIAEAQWDDLDDEGNGEQVFVSASKSSTGIAIDVDAFKGSFELCDDGGTPDDPDDDFYGFVGTQTSGSGPVKLSIAKQYRAATASGTVKVEITTFDECTGDFGSTTTKSIKVALDLTAISPLIRESSRSTISVPKQFRLHQLIKATSRVSVGTMSYGSRSFDDVDGVIGQLYLKGHLNAK